MYSIITLSAGGGRPGVPGVAASLRCSKLVRQRRRAALMCGEWQGLNGALMY